MNQAQLGIVRYGTVIFAYSKCAIALRSKVSISSFHCVRGTSDESFYFPILVSPSLLVWLLAIFTSGSLVCMAPGLINDSISVPLSSESASQLAHQFYHCGSSHISGPVHLNGTTEHPTRSPGCGPTGHNVTCQLITNAQCSTLNKLSALCLCFVFGGNTPSLKY